MLEVTRELIAYAIIAVIVIGAALAYIATRGRRRREALRRRGIKSFN